MPRSSSLLVFGLVVVVFCFLWFRWWCRSFFFRLSSSVRFFSASASSFLSWVAVSSLFELLGRFFRRFRRLIRTDAVSALWSLSLSLVFPLSVRPSVLDVVPHPIRRTRSGAALLLIDGSRIFLVFLCFLRLRPGYRVLVRLSLSLSDGFFSFQHGARPDLTPPTRPDPIAFWNGAGKRFPNTPWNLTWKLDLSACPNPTLDAFCRRRRPSSRRSSASGTTPRRGRRRCWRRCAPCSTCLRRHRRLH